MLAAARNSQERQSLSSLETFLVWLAKSQPRDGGRYGLPILVTTSSLVITGVVYRLTGDSIYELPLLACAFSAWYGGVIPGVASAIAGALGTYLSATEPLYSFTLTKSDDMISLALLPVVAVLIGLMYEATRVAENRAEALVVELEEANSAKDEFLGLVSHELRTPITIIVGNASLLDRDDVAISDDEKLEMLHAIHEHAGRLQILIENLLMLARDASASHADDEPLSVPRIIEKMVHKQEAVVPDRQINCELHRDGAIVLGNPVFMEQIILNLLTNAEKYSPREQPIDVTMAVAGQEVKIVVGDRGKGIAPAEIETIFTPFYRAKGTSSAPGIGVGLAVCKRLVERMSGRVWAQPRDGGGTEFVVTFPAATEGLSAEL
jgi:K+-sensing histidine kinase KdpD